jgi:hypothetical protein
LFSRSYRKSLCQFSIFSFSLFLHQLPTTCHTRATMTMRDMVAVIGAGVQGRRLAYMVRILNLEKCEPFLI